MLRLHPRQGLCVAGMVGVLAFAPGIEAQPASASSAASPTALPPSKLTVSATLEQCLTAEAQDERSATFSGEMATIVGSTKMEMRIDVLERTPLEASYRTVSAPGLSVWRSSAPGVKVYKYLKQVTNLSGPAFYRAAVRFRWLNAKGRLIAATELHTRRCEQPGGNTPATPTPEAGETPPSGATTTSPGTSAGS